MMNKTPLIEEFSFHVNKDFQYFDYFEPLSIYLNI